MNARLKLTLGADGLLRDDQGHVLGAISELSLELELDNLSDLDFLQTERSDRSSATTKRPVEASDAVADDQATEEHHAGCVFDLEDQQQSLIPASAKDAGSATDSGRARGFDPVREVWDWYVQVMNPRAKGLDAQSRAIVREALKVATIDECKRAIDGCRLSDFHMGENDRGTKYNAISQILKGKRGGRTTREQIDFFLELAENSRQGSGVTSATNARISQAKRDCLDAFEFPNDDRVVERGEQAQAWLEQQGWTVKPDPTGRPTFNAP